MNRKSSDLLKLGIGLLIVGILLAYYSIVSYVDFRSLNTRVDFDSVDNNVQMPDSERYYQYLSYADFLSQKLEKNKDLIIKNESCAYLDYAHHNAIALYSLTDVKMSEQTKKDAALGIVKELYDKLGYYSTCKNYKIYKDELRSVLNSHERQNDKSKDERMKLFLNSEPEGVESSTGEVNIERVTEPQSAQNVQGMEFDSDKEKVPETHNVHTRSESQSSVPATATPQTDEPPVIRY